MAGIRGAATFAPYVASKHAVVGLTRCAALTAQIDPDDPDGVFERTSVRVPLGRYGTVGEVASLVVWLLSDEASYLSGATHLIDGALNA
jgi:NAD(P)-dependent dehydrogenase (short-subunit alcohol dehydrogenase family)